MIYSGTFLNKSNLGILEMIGNCNKQSEKSHCIITVSIF